MNRGELLALAAKAEAAMASDRELDLAIHYALGHVPADAAPCKGGWIVKGKPVSAAKFTTSLDAAMTLVPEGLRLMLSEWDDNVHLRSKGPWQAVLSKPGDDASFDAMRGFRCDHAATPALALTAACLKARAATIGTDHE